MRILKHLTSWTQHEKTLQETITFTTKRKSPFSYSDPEGNMEKKKTTKKNLKPFSLAAIELYISRLSLIVRVNGSPEYDCCC